MQRDGFGENPLFRCLMAEDLQFCEKNHSLPKRRAVGYAVFHNIYSTWDGRALYMVDLYVEPASRGKQWLIHNFVEFSLNNIDMTS